MRALVLCAILLASCGGETESTPVDDAAIDSSAADTRTDASGDTTPVDSAPIDSTTDSGALDTGAVDTGKPDVSVPETGTALREFVRAEPRKRGRGMINNYDLVFRSGTAGVYHLMAENRGELMQLVDALMAGRNPYR